MMTPGRVGLVGEWGGGGWLDIERVFVMILVAV
jgi:hypothetical protein